MGKVRSWVDRYVASGSWGENCVEWPFSIRKDGYGRVKRDGILYNAHHLILRLAKGDPPTALHHAAHIPIVCHNRACVNPNHLYWATPAENVADKITDRTLTIGAKQPNSKLSPEAVRFIRSSKQGVPEIARRFGVDQKTIRQVLTRATWDHVA